MIKTAALIVLCAMVAVAPSTQAAVADETPYYMCFAYTPDGMHFAGGDFKFERARKMMTENCSMPKNLTVVAQNDHGAQKRNASRIRA
jgi:hypothetical protein